MLKKWIVFVGLSGSGKSFYAKKLASKLNVNCFDLDNLIKEEQNQSIVEIFKKQGESFFRECEEKTFFNTISSKEPAIISLGGGSLNNNKLKNYVAENCFCIYMDKKIHKIYKVVRNNQRPLLLKNTKTTLNTMLQKRLADYKNANLTINCNKRNSNSKQMKNIIKCLYSNKII